jgi:1,4-dihydroxy-6-naphthoate synthase
MPNLKLAHSPDSDDAFMFYALATKKIRTGDLKFTHILEDIESLNQKALQGTYDITAISFHAYAYVADHYLLLPCGASFGDGYGPIVVGRNTLEPRDLKGKRIAVPGKLTTATLALRLYEPDVELVITPFDQILDRVAKGDVDAGVVIHEGQLTYAKVGLSKILDLGEWWHQQTGLPLPLGGNAILRSLDQPTLKQATSVIGKSIQYGLAHREEALAYASQFAPALDSESVDRFVSMYVNEWTLDYGPAGRQAVSTLLSQAHERGLLATKVNPEFVG